MKRPCQDFPLNGVGWIRLTVALALIGGSAGVIRAQDDWTAQVVDLQIQARTEMEREREKIVEAYQDAESLIETWLHPELNPDNDIIALLLFPGFCRQLGVDRDEFLKELKSSKSRAKPGKELAEKKEEVDRLFGPDEAPSVDIRLEKMDLSRSNLERILDPNQFDDFWRMYYRRLGIRSFLHPQFQSQWKFNASQTKAIEETFREYYLDHCKWKRFQLGIDKKKPEEPTGLKSDLKLISRLREIVGKELARQIKDDLKTDLLRSPIVINRMQPK
jgi:hypothetical protein